MGINIAQTIRHWAVCDPERVAVIVERSGVRTTFTYAEVDRAARRAACVLEAHGVCLHTRVVLCVEDPWLFLTAFWGSLYVGATLLPVSPLSVPPELSFRLTHAGSKLLIHDDATLALCAAASSMVEGATMLSAATFARAAAEHTGPHDLPEGSVAMVLYTSGTTGTAKGAQITHASLFTHTAALVHHTLSLRDHDVVLGCLPLSHSYGIRMTLLAPFYAGARVVLHERFSRTRVYDALKDERVSWFPGVPTMFHALAHGATRAPSHAALRWCLSAGAPLAPEIRVRAEQALGAKVRQGYGLTEATFTSVARPEDGDTAADTVGKPVFGVEVRILDAQGNALPAHVPGEVAVRGQNLMAGYLDDEPATRAAHVAGFMRTGDVGTLDEHGFLRVVDRIKDLILRGGHNVYPAEVEAVLVAHPQIFDAIVVGIPDEHYGEEVVAVVVTREGANLDLTELVGFCRARLSSTKLPRWFGRVKALPIGASGKLQRRVVRSDVQQGNIPLEALAQVHGERRS